MLQIFARDDVKRSIQQTMHPQGFELVFPHRIDTVDGGDPNDARSNLLVRLVIGGEVLLVHPEDENLKISQRCDRSIIIATL